MNTKVLHKITLLKFIKGLIVIAFGIFTANLVSTIVDSGTTGKTQAVIRVSVILLGVVVLYEGFIFVFNIIIERIKETKSQAFRINVYKGFLDRPIYDMGDLKTGSFINNFTDDVGQVIKLYTDFLPGLLSNIVMVLAYVIFIGTMDFKLALILVSIGLIQVVPPIIVKRFMVENYDDTVKIESELTDYIIEGFHGRSTIKALNLKEGYLDGVKKIHHRYLKIGSKSELTAQGQNAMEHAVEAVLKFGTYGLLGWFVVSSHLNLTTATKAIVLSGALYGAMNGIFTVIPHIGVARKARERAGVLYSEVDNRAAEDVKDFSKEKVIEVKNLSFSYDKSHRVLKDVSFNINKGDRVVIQGENGSGKSTLFNTLLGMHKDYEGDILVHGKNLRTMDFEDYFQSIACISQEDYGFDLCPREFLEMLAEGCSLNLEEAYKLGDELGIKAEALENEKIGDLSGGEKKKLYLVASLLKEGEILFLDEPGNCLDGKGKEALRERLLISHKVIILITHDEFFEELANVKLRVHEGLVSVKDFVDRGVV